MEIIQQSVFKLGASLFKSCVNTMHRIDLTLTTIIYPSPPPFPATGSQIVQPDISESYHSISTPLRRLGGRHFDEIAPVADVTQLHREQRRNNFVAVGAHSRKKTPRRCRLQPSSDLSALRRDAP